MMERLLQKDIWIKVFSIALAFLLWAVVMEDYNTEVTKEFDVTLTVIQHPTYQIFDEGSQIPDSVTVRVTGRKLVVSKLKAASIKATLDLSRIAEIGKPVAVEVRSEGPSSTLLTYHVVPKTVTVTLVENGEKKVPVSLINNNGIVTVQGRDWRYQAKPASDEASVMGRIDYLNMVARAVITLDPKELNPNVTKLSKLVTPVDESGKTVEKLKNTYLEVNLTWERLPPGKNVKVQPVVRGEPPAGYVVRSVDVNPPTVTVRALTQDAPAPAIDAIETKPVDVTGQTKSFTTTVPFIIPGGVSVVADTATVTVTIEEATVDRVFKGVPIMIAGKAADLDAALGVTEAQVHVKGPYSTVTTLDPSAVQVYVDVENLGEGKHRLLLKANRIPGAVVDSIDPSSVEVTLTKK